LVSPVHTSFASMLSYFFVAEDGIRNLIVTGVQLCALPIFGSTRSSQWLSLWIKIFSDNHRLQRVLPTWFYGLIGVTGMNRVARKIGRASCRERGGDSVGSV